MAVPTPTVLRCFSETWRITTASRTGGQGLSGGQQFAVSPGGRWAAKSSFHLRDWEAAQVDVRGFLAALDGQFGTFMLGPTDWRGQPWNVDPLTGAPITPGAGARSVAVDPSFGTSPDTTSSLDFTLSQAVGVNATNLVLQRNRGGKLRRGQYLQIGDRLHIIVGITTGDPVDPNTQQAVSGTIGVVVRPWTRTSYAAGTPVNFTNPQCLMRFSDASPAGVEMTTSPLSDITFDVIEAFL